ncbi:Actin-depolymerizing factor 5 [Nymphaea thermarum]|nr:Actin-depolymerizing factor 5 [Nymphaea thermarum]
MPTCSFLTKRSLFSCFLVHKRNGLPISDECKNMFTELKKKKAHKFIVFKIDEHSKLVMVDQVGGSAASYEELAASLPIDDCRYAVFDFDFVTIDNFPMSKTFLITWSPSASKIRAKMLYATFKDGLRRALEGIHYELQATDPTEMGIEVIKDKAK